MNIFTLYKHEPNGWLTREFSCQLINLWQLIRQLNLAPLQWAMGRVQEVYPGPDGHAHRNCEDCQGFLREATV